MAYGSEMLNAVNDIKTALGGTNDGGIEYGSELLNTVVDIKTIVENGGGGGGGGGLPEVDSTDNGKVLTVVEGSWAAANPSGGSGAIILHATSCNKTDEESYAYYDFTPNISLEDFKSLFTLDSASPVYMLYPIFDNNSPYFHYASDGQGNTLVQITTCENSSFAKDIEGTIEYYVYIDGEALYIGVKKPIMI